jgi:aspartate/methionine/tyrosine aminotransferase
MSRFQSHRTADFTESVIREMTRLAIRHDAVNLAQGFPDFAAPEALKQAACDAIQADINQYTVTWGARPLRDAIAAKYRAYYGLEFDPEREITVCCGSTEGMIASLLATTNDGEEIIVFEPFYENYHPDAHLSGAIRRVVSLQAPDWTFDPAELRAAFNHKTKAIILNTPHNPTGKVFSRAELEIIAALCQEFDCLAITDEIYEHITYDGHIHIPIIALHGMRERTILVNSMSKTFSVTGWRVGWVLAAPDLSASIRKVHDFLTVGAAAPLQAASAVALGWSHDYYVQLAAGYRDRRDYCLRMLRAAGINAFTPQGAYYVMADIANFGWGDDRAFAMHLLETVGVAAVPGSSFYSRGIAGSNQIRFCFCKKYDTLNSAGERLGLLTPA